MELVWLNTVIEKVSHLRRMFVLDKLATFGQSAWYWVAIIVMGLLLEGSALYYQYALDYYPCVLCIHIRIWVMAIIILAAITLFVRHIRPLLIASHLISVGLFIGLLERCWMTFAVERLMVDGSCSMDSGLPAWFALDKWFPWIFEVQEACGYTPQVLFGITMAEALLLIAGGAVLVGLLMSVATIFSKKA